MSLRWRIALAVAAVAALTTLAVGLASYRSTRDRLYAEIDRSLVVERPAMAGPQVEIDADSGTIVIAPDGPLGLPGLYEVQQLGRDGAVRAGTLEDPWPVSPRARSVVGEQRGRSIETVTVAGSQYRVLTAGTRFGAVQIGRSLAETNRVLASLRNRTLVIVLTSTVLAALIGSLIAGRVTASLRRLTAAADTVRTTGKLDVDVAADGRDEVSRLGSSFGAMLESLADSKEEQRRLVQDAGHELKTPLTSIRTNLDVLRRHPDLGADQRGQVIGDLHSEVEQMVDLVEEIVAVAAGVAADEPSVSFSLGDVAVGVVQRYRRRTGREFEVETDESPVVAQPSAVQRAVSNLVDNAVKFTPTESPITVTVRDGRLAVLDRGPGFHARDLPLLFERFHRADDARSLPGSGLGLSIVRDVVVRNGGTVAAANRDGGGAVVEFTLPAGPARP